jgi:hypothetical protein
MKDMPDSARGGMTDVMNIGGDLVPGIDAVLNGLLERGKRERVMILAGTEMEGSRRQKPYAITKVEIAFDNEDSLRTCVRLLRWSDDRLRARPDQLILWEWQSSFREGMTIHFGVAWYDREFFEKRKNAFMEPQHANYYAYFGAKPEDFKMEHEIFG